MAKVIETEDLSVAFGEGRERSIIFSKLNLAVEAGEFVTLVGVSGAGKSTLLRVIADLIPPYEGLVKIDTPHDPTRRRIAMVFQAANLMPWRRIGANVGLGLEGIEVTEEQRRARIQSTLELVGLADYVDRWPYQLSGGQVQRIGIARALAVDPDILLMDEPFGALDAITRTALQDELLRLWRATRKSVLFVTHDIEEAVYLGDRVLLLGGRPAHVVNEFTINIEREQRRASSEFQSKVEEVKAGLVDAIALSSRTV